MHSSLVRIVIIKLDNHLEGGNQFFFNLQDAIKAWNDADGQLYDYFNKSLWKKIEEEPDGFWTEVELLKEKTKSYNENCMYSKPKSHTNTSFTLPIDIRQDLEPDIKLLCERSALPEKKYIKLLKEKQRRKIETSNKELVGSKFYRNSSITNIYIEYVNQTKSSFDNKTAEENNGKIRTSTNQLLVETNPQDPVILR